MRPSAFALVVLLALPACLTPGGLSSDVDPGADASSGSSAASTGPAPDAPDPGQGATTSSSSGGSSSTTGDDDEGDTTGGCSFLCPDTDGVDEGWCDPWDDACPEGQKCTPYWDPDHSDFVATCADVHPLSKAIGEHCQIFGEGSDDCDPGAVCWDPDPQTGIGMCMELCGGSPEAPTCATPSTTCNMNKSGVLALCMPNCMPLDLDTCPVGCTCVPAQGTDFWCLVDASGDAGAYGDPCEYVNACDPGLVCLSPESVPKCEAGGCCSPYCRLSDPTCPNDAMECVAWFEEGTAPAGYEDVGVCVLAR